MAPRAIAIGTDCPAINVTDLTTVADQLEQHDLAIGPSADGGYWSLGVANHAAIDCSCAADLPWSQPHLRRETHARAEQQHLSIASGPQLDDLDTAADWQRAMDLGLLDPITIPPQPPCSAPDPRISASRP
ncbi:MAG: DUF2064 domain-containing protein [Sphaerospermopsis sp. SIO1G2]|nr:DUF2064 domain-containing protein [Sphaerospermopsis sp. SIO1G2]